MIGAEISKSSNKAENGERFFFLNIIEKNEGCVVFKDTKGPFLGNSEQGYIAAGFGCDGIAVEGAIVRDGVD